MFPRHSLALFITLSLGALLSSTSCGPTCPAGEQNCGTPVGSTAGAAGSDDDGTTTCAQLTALRTCMDSFCATADNPFCTCYKRGYDIRSDTCKCSEFNAAAFCRQAELSGVDPTKFDCPASSGAVATVCIGVQ